MPQHCWQWTFVCAVHCTALYSRMWASCHRGQASGHLKLQDKQKAHTPVSTLFRPANTAIVAPVSQLLTNSRSHVSCGQIRAHQNTLQLAAAACTQANPRVLAAFVSTLLVEGPMQCLAATGTTTVVRQQPRVPSQGHAWTQHTGCGSHHQPAAAEVLFRSTFLTLVQFQRRLAQYKTHLQRCVGRKGIATWTSPACHGLLCTRDLYTRGHHCTHVKQQAQNQADKPPPPHTHRLCPTSPDNGQGQRHCSM